MHTHPQGLVYGSPDLRKLSDEQLDRETRGLCGMHGRKTDLSCSACASVLNTASEARKELAAREPKRGWFSWF